MTADSHNGNDNSNGAGAQTLRCPSCRSQVKPSDAACSTCGYGLNATPPLEVAHAQEVAPPAVPAPPPLTLTTTAAAVTNIETPKTQPAKRIPAPAAGKPAPSNAVTKQAESKPTPRVRQRRIPPIVGFTIVFVSTIGGVLLFTAVARNLVLGNGTAQGTAASSAAATSASTASTKTPQPAAASVAATDTPAPNGLYDVELVTARYEITGRPAKGCGLPDAADPVRKFTFTLAITNKTGADTDAAKWGTAAFTQNGRASQVCYFDTEGPAVPDLPKNRTQRVTLSAFVERNESVAAILVGDSAGNAQRICVRGTQRIQCQ
jgi:hypothetical protein